MNIILLRLKPILILLIIISFCFQNKLLKAQNEVIVLDNDTKLVTVGLFSEILIDSTNSVSIEDILKKNHSSAFQETMQPNPNFGYSNAAFWFRFKIKDISSVSHQWLMQITHANMDFIDVFIFDSSGDYIQKSTGALAEFSTRDYEHPTFLFNLTLLKNEEQIVYVHFKGKSSKQFPINIIEKNDFIEKSHTEDIFTGIYIGFFVVMILYNLFIFFSIRSISYLYYVLFILSFLLLQLSLIGHIYRFSDLLSPRVANLSNLVFAGMTALFGVQFAKNFLKLKELIPLAYKILHIFDFLSILLITLVFFAYFYPALLAFLPSFTSYLVLVSIVALLVVGTISSIQGYRPARFYMLAWSFLLVSGLIYVLRTSGLLPNNYFTFYSLRIGSALEVLLLSLGLADRFRIAENETRKAQEEAIKTLREKENLITGQNKILEKAVQKRTESITQQAEELKLQRDALEKQSIELSKKNEDTLSSINYAQRIQQAIIPSETRIKEALDEFFIVFKPREIVSGDFYWMSKKENKVIVAVIDCTGHGVPGAFMSMIGNDLLNHLVHDKEIHEPDKILNEMHKGIRYALKQDETDNRDGMDISLIVIDKEDNTVTFAGAKNSLVYIQNNALYQIKGDKMPIGGEQRETERVFAKHKIQLGVLASSGMENESGELSETVLYLFTDGYQDQFGGIEGKKFMLSRLKETFLAIHQKPMADQKVILEKILYEWMEVSTQRQIDDILIMGIKL